MPHERERLTDDILRFSDKELIQKAKEEVEALCEKTKTWRMSIPVNINDSDIVFIELIMRYEAIMKFRPT